MGEHPARVFLLSPASAAGRRAELLRRDGSRLALAEALRSEQGAAIGEVYTFLSSLYFRGKLTYAAAFAAPVVGTQGVPGTLVITPGHGLCRPSTPVRLSHLVTMEQLEVDARNSAFVEPLRRDATLLHASLPADCQVVLLGSVATGKYVEPLLEVFAERLVFPREFVGRGNLSRGGLLLRAVREGSPLELVSVASSARRGPRARKLDELHARGRRPS
jgi:hypothetical protein